MTHEQAVEELAGMAPAGSHYAVDREFNRFASGRTEWEWAVYVRIEGAHANADVVHQYTGPDVVKLLGQMRAALA
jgi:hypothetical protein